MDATPSSRGVLRSAGPGSLTLDRIPPGDAVASLVRHHWIARWSVPVGQVREQSMLEYPSGNLLIDATRVVIGGPSPGRSTVALEGDGWVLGVLLQPPALHRLAGPAVERLVGAVEPLPQADAVAEAVVAMLGSGPLPPAPLDPERARRAVAVVEQWLAGFVDHSDEEAELITGIVATVEDAPQLTRVDDLAARFGLTERALQRLVRRRLGVTPKWLIRRRRMQDAADRLHRGAPVDLATLAAELGFADQAHFSREFARVTGMTPTAYRRADGMTL